MNPRLHVLEEGGVTVDLRESIQVVQVTHNGLHARNPLFHSRQGSLALSAPLTLLISDDVRVIVDKCRRAQ